MYTWNVQRAPIFRFTDTPLWHCSTLSKIATPERIQIKMVVSTSSPQNHIRWQSDMEACKEWVKCTVFVIFWCLDHELITDPISLLI